MIDAHVHVVPPNLPGAGSLSPLLDGPLDALAEVLRREMLSAGVREVLAMGCRNGSDDDPLGVAGTLRVAAALPGLHAVGVADPTRGDAGHLRRAAEALASGKVRALKAYLGYLPYGPDHPGYEPYYHLAARHRVPVIFHTGDTYSPRARLRYSQPLPVDDVAVDHPEVRFVLAHFGNPWLTDAAEVVYKNVNVWADLSGLVIGADANAGEERQEAIAQTSRAVRQAMLYAERPNRFVYGSDWPLTPMLPYREFIQRTIPAIYHGQVFEENPRVLYRL